MWQLMFFVCITSWASAQNEVGVSREHNGHGWDIRLAVPGEPGRDYPTLGAVPRTGFSCAGRDPGYYADIESGCQVFRVCTVGSTYGFQSFLCPNGTLFNQAVFVCDWWMNVNCQESQQLFNNNNEQFGNLRLGPQLMKDIKKMLTHPMRNPYDRNSMKSNLIVMQDYKPPAGQLFPNGALIAGPERSPNKVYMPPKHVKQYTIQNPFAYVNNTFAQTTSDPKFLPAVFSTVPSITRTTEVFQRQRGDTRFVQSTQIPQTTSIISNGHARQFTSNKVTGLSSNNNNFNTQLQRPTQNYNPINQQRQTNTATQTLQSSQRTQIGAQQTQYVDDRKPQLDYDKQTEFGRITKQNILNSNQNFPAYTYRPPLPLNLKDIPGDVPNDIKQNVALVFSLLADSINAAKEYTNIAQQESLSTTLTPPPLITPQFPIINNGDLSQITNKISQLTSSQYSGNNYNITNQIYNKPDTGAFVQSIVTPQRDVQNIQQMPNQNNIVTSPKESNTQVEIVQSESLPIDPAKLQLDSNKLESFSSEESLKNLLNSDNGISAHLQDKIIGTIPHPLEQNKLVTYEKEKSYYLFSKLDNNLSTKESKSNALTQLNNIQRQNVQTTTASTNEVPNSLAFQFLPSIGYQLENEKDQEKLLNTFQIDDFGAPREVTKANLVQSNNGNDNSLTSNLDYSVDHTTVKQDSNQLNSVSTLYNGPSSYLTPQSSIGGLVDKQVVQDSNVNSKLETLDDSEGYPKERPAREFTF
ncbi:hypothetical protein K1T71_010384 [Dendrolimus kikuchii]|uniref:Uncharacterized protein n=1 Tax=Dendrolimus kikuchii TaxID=765133 RepID=A0ACC1CRQ5_9NEOP|nr:hypothetical protein K1T71_010384 [Dendrolimus kikuchii]